MPTMISTKEFTSAPLPTAIRNGRAHKNSCQTELECWGVFVRVCSLSNDDCQKISSLGYSSMKTLSMFGLHHNAQPLLCAGLEDAKASMVLLFATFVLHSIHHKLKIPKGLTFDQVLDFSFHLASVNSSDDELSKAKLLEISTACADDTQSRPSRRSRHSRGRRQGSSESRKKTVSFEMDESYQFSTTNSASVLAVSQNSLASGISRWSSCIEKPSGGITKRDSGSSSGSDSTRMVSRPFRRPSITEYDAEACCSDHAATASTSNQVEGNQWNDCAAYVAPKYRTERESLCWVAPLDVNEDLTDSDYSESDDDASSDSDDEDLEEKDGERNGNNSRSGQSTTWKEQNALPHDCSLPANKVLPADRLFHVAARDPEMDISESIHSALAGKAA